MLAFQCNLKRRQSSNEGTNKGISQRELGSLLLMSVRANIPFLAKVIVIVAVQIHSYLEENLLMPSMQSSYCKHHSTETTLLQVMNAILWTVDCRQDVVLVMLDLPAAFDTLDHLTILLDRLSRYFGFSHTVLRWFSSYLTGRIQSVTTGNTTSSSWRLEFGVPQSSILGPLLFTRYTAPIQDIISAHNLDCMFCADDSQLYITVDPHDQHPSEVYLFSEVIERNIINKLV